MYMEAGGYDLVIRDLRMSIPTRQVAWPFSRFNFNSPRVEEKERRKREKKFEKYRRANLPSIKIGNIKRMLAGFKVRNMDSLYRPVLRAGHDTAIVKYDFDSSRRIMELFRVLWGEYNRSVEPGNRDFLILLDTRAAIRSGCRRSKNTDANTSVSLVNTGTSAPG